MKCFYHNDLDGRASAACVRRYEGISVNPNSFIEMDYTNPSRFEEALDGEVVYIVDYSFTPNTSHYLLALNARCDVIWIDHHDSSINLMNDNEEFSVENIKGIRDKKSSGAVLTYEYLFGPIMDLDYRIHFLQLVSDYDTWTFKYGEMSKFFKLGMDSIPHGPLNSIWNDLFKEEENNQDSLVGKIVSDGKAIKRYIDLDNAEYLNSHSYESHIGEHSVLVVNKKTNSWIFGDRINDYDICCVWVYDGEAYRYSIYSVKENINCSQIAQLFGGGGHKGAAGFTMDELIFNNNPLPEVV